MDYSPRDRRLLMTSLSNLTPPELAALIKPWIQRQREQQQQQPGHQDQVYLYNKRLGQLLKCLGSTLPMELVTHLLYEFPLDNSVQTTMFSRYVKKYMGSESDSTVEMETLLNYLDSMTADDNIKVRLYNMVLNGCLKRGNEIHVKKILNHMDSSRCLLDTASFNMLIRSQLDNGNVKAATALYGKMINGASAPTTATYNTFIKYTCQHQLWNDMTLWLDRLLRKEEEQPSPVTLRILMTALTDHIDQPMVLNAFERVVKRVPVKSIDLEMTVNTSIVHLLRHKYTDQALDILRLLFDRSSSSMEKYGLSVYSYNLLIHALVQKGNLEAAEQVLVTMRDQQQQQHDGDDSTMTIPSPDIISYTTLIHGYIRTPNGQDIDIGRVLALYTEVMDRGLEPNATLQAVILYGMVKSGFQDIKECTSLFETLVCDNKENDDNKDTLDFSNTVGYGRSYEPQWDLYNDMQNTGRRKMDPRVSRMTMYNIMMDGYFLHQLRSRHRQSSGDDDTKMDRHIPPEPLALLNRAIENKLPLETATLNIWVRGLAVFHHDLAAAEAMVKWMWMAHGVEMNERTVYYLVRSSIAQNRRDKARKWIKLYEDSGRTIQGAGLLHFKDMVDKS
ncbi:hypothetical protein BC941DRAFT_452359 [Chlamydoabsidia padenii]|nr:hypothetical protein BC941DRAFT_452359 [Chlamydoabsidia padenii]